MGFRQVSHCPRDLELDIVRSGSVWDDNDLPDAIPVKQRLGHGDELRVQAETFGFRYAGSPTPASHACPLAKGPKWNITSVHSLVASRKARVWQSGMTPMLRDGFWPTSATGRSVPSKMNGADSRSKMPSRWVNERSSRPSISRHQEPLSVRLARSSILHQVKGA